MRVRDLSGSGRAVRRMKDGLPAPALSESHPRGLACQPELARVRASEGWWALVDSNH